MAALSLKLERVRMEESDLTTRLNNLDTFMTDRVVSLEQTVKRHDREILILIGIVVLFELFNSVALVILQENNK